MKRKKKIILGIILLILIPLTFYLIQKRTNIEADQIKEFIRSFGILGPLVFMILNSVFIVFAPLTSFPLWVASLALYGFWQTLCYVWISFNVGAVVNFWIARRWGRPVVSKLVGKKGVEKVDEITEVIGLQVLLIIRLIGGASSDYVAYAAGLTNMKFKPYFLVTLLASPPTTFINVYVIYQIISLKPTFFFFGIAGYLLTVIVPIFVYHRQRKKLKG